MRAPLALLALAALLLAAPPARAEPLAVDVQAYVLNVGNYDTTKGTYTVDLYLVFSWDATAAGNVTPLKYEFMNGRATSTDRLSDETDENGTRTVTWRVQANLYAEPQFADYPYDTQRIEVLFEDAVHGRHEVVYRVDMEGSGLDEAVRIAGWRIQGWSFTEAPKQYPPDEEFSRARFTVVVEREPLSTTIKSFLPPVAFCLVAGLGFFFHPSKVANRITLGTGMLISAVAFHISQTQALPPLAQLILFDKVMLCVYAFIVGCLIVSTLIHIDEDYWKEKDYTRQINVIGAGATLCLTAVLFLLLVFV